MGDVATIVEEALLSRGAGWKSGHSHRGITFPLAFLDLRRMEKQELVGATPPRQGREA